jgi:prophage antirepressor-like protein
MSTDLELFEFQNQPVRIVMIDGDPWFVLADLCAVLDLTNPSVVAQRIDQAALSQAYISSGGQQRKVTVASEAGMYEVVFRSDKPEAVAFRRWITGEVLPQIRRTGSYGVDIERLTPLEYAKKLVDAETRAEEGAQFKRAIEGGDGLGIRVFHKKYFSEVPEHVFFEHLYSKSLLIDQRGKGSLRTGGPKAGTYRDGSQHRHPTYKGKQFFYMHGARDKAGVRRENTHVRPGRPELALRDLLVSQGLPANENTNGMYALTTGRDS